MIADGYNRSEASIVLLLQKASEAKRSYCTLLSVNSMTLGNTNLHIAEHDVGDCFKTFLLDCYEQNKIDPVSVEYIEANGSGLKVRNRPNPVKKWPKKRNVHQKKKKI